MQNRLDSGQRGHNRALNAAVVLSPEDLEGSVETPVRVPGVGQQPVGSAVLHTPPEQPDRMSAQHAPVDVLVDTGLVVDKVFVDGEGGLGGSVGHQLLHDGALLMLNIMGLREIQICIRPKLMIYSVNNIDSTTN